MSDVADGPADGVRVEVVDLELEHAKNRVRGEVIPNLVLVWSCTYVTAMIS